MLAAQGKQLEELQASNTQVTPRTTHTRVPDRPRTAAVRPPALSFARAHSAAPPLSQILEQLAKLKGILVDLAPAAAPAAK